MNALNRVFIVLALLLSIPVLAVLFLWPQVVLVGLGTRLIDWGQLLDATFMPWFLSLIGVALTLVWAAIAIFFIYLELRRGRRHFIRVPQISGGTVTLSIESIVQHLQYRLDPIPGVIRVRPEIRTRGDGVLASVNVGVVQGVSVPQMSAGLVEIIRRALTEDLGLKVAADPQVQITLLTPPGSRPVVPPPTPMTVPPMPSAAPLPTPQMPELRPEEPEA